MKKFISSLLSKFSRSKSQVVLGSCPECSSSLQAFPGFKVAVCGQCSGFWVRPDDVNTLLTTPASQLGSLLGNQVVEELTTASSAQRSCPECRQPMQNYQFDQSIELWLDACESGHGVWFDPGELDIVREAVSNAAPTEAGEETVKMTISANMSDLAIRIAVFFKYAEVIYQGVVSDLPHPIWKEPKTLFLAKKVGILFFLGSMPSRREISELTEAHLEIFDDCETVIKLMNEPKMQSHRSMALVTNLEFLTYCCCYYVTAGASAWSDVSQEEAMHVMGLLGRALEEHRNEVREQADATLAQARQKCPAPSSAAGSSNSDTFQCRRCDSSVTNGSEEFEINGQHSHSLANPQGDHFTVRLFSRAEGITLKGEPVFEGSWFEGYGWRMGFCSGCQGHLGWHFQGEGSSFFGLRAEALKY